MLTRNGWASACEVCTAAELFNLSITTLLKGLAFDSNLRQLSVKYTAETYGTNNLRCITLHLANSHFNVLCQVSPSLTTPNDNITRNTCSNISSNTIASSKTHLRPSTQLKAKNEKKQKQATKI
jgi:hypothetical protein